MQLNIEPLDKYPPSTRYEKELIERIDIRGEKQASVAKSCRKDTSTISIKHIKALQKLASWMRNTDDIHKH